jgi:hypothetical protein
MMVESSSSSLSGIHLMEISRNNKKVEEKKKETKETQSNETVAQDAERRLACREGKNGRDCVFVMMTSRSR